MDPPKFAERKEPLTTTTTAKSKSIQDKYFTEEFGPNYTYIVDKDFHFFQDSVMWCQDLGGKLVFSRVDDNLNHVITMINKYNLLGVWTLANHMEMCRHHTGPVSLPGINNTLVNIECTVMRNNKPQSLEITFNRTELNKALPEDLSSKEEELDSKTSFLMKSKVNCKKTETCFWFGFRDNTIRFPRICNITLKEETLFDVKGLTYSVIVTGILFIVLTIYLICMIACAGIHKYRPVCRSN